MSDGTSIRDGSLAAVIMPAALLGGAASAASFLTQTAGRASPAEVAILVAALTAAEAGGCALASRWRAATMRDHILLAALGSLLVLVAIVVPPTLPLCALALGLLPGLTQPRRAAAIQRVVGDSIRARATSAASACDMAVTTIVLPLAGVWRSRRR